MKTIKVKGCRGCLLLDYDFTLDDYKCMHPLLNSLIHPTGMDIAPENCPLRKEPIKIELDNENRS